MLLDTSCIEETLASLVQPKKNPLFTLLFQAASYSLLSPGKRLRPQLVMATAEALGKDPKTVLLPACAVELLHTYSLIHDDLPCMDDDDMRRGKPTLHKVYPEGQAVLAGDLLLTLSFETLAKSPGFTPLQILEMIQVLAGRSGGEGLIGGQSLDLLFEEKTISWELLQQIHLGKTASLISACFEIGAIASEASLSAKNTLAQIGEKIGLAFQIVDDILDAEQEEKKKKSSSVSLLGLSPAKALAEELLLSSLKLCEALNIEHSFLATHLLPRLVHRFL